MTTGSHTAGAEAPLAQRLLDGVPLGLALLEPSGEIRLANRAAEAFLGYGAGELAGRALADLYEPPGREKQAPERALASARRDGRMEDNGALLARRDGSTVRGHLVLTLLPSAPDAAGAAGFTLEVREVADGLQVEAALRARLAREEELRRRAEEASHARDEFLATLSHELRTPLTAIMGWAHLLRTGNLDEKSRARALETIERNAHLEAQLTADILDVARIITGKLRVQMQTVDVAQVVESAVETVRQQAEDKHVMLQVAAESGAAVAADPDRLQQVVGNLLTNAIKFTPDGGEVRVCVVAGAQTVAIEIQDTGEGIDGETLPHVFERFRQGGAGARRKGGLGLGLAIVSHIVDLHSGRVRADSAGPGRGSTFTVELPSLLERPIPAVAAAPEETLASPRLHGLTVLVVDDQEDARELMRVVLGRCGATVVAAESTATALEALDRCRPDVILSDLEMPGEDGFSLIRKVRARPPERGGAVPAAALTAYARTEDRVHSLRAGFHRHVPKPVQPDELANIVASLAGRG